MMSSTHKHTHPDQKSCDIADRQTTQARSEWLLLSFKSFPSGDLNSGPYFMRGPDDVTV